MMKYTFYLKVFMNFRLKVYIKLKMIAEMQNYKFEVKRVSHLVSLLFYIFLGIVLRLLSDAISGFKY